MATCEELYSDIHRRSSTVMKVSFEEDTEGHQSQSHAFLSDIETWLVVLNSKPEKVLLQAGLIEYQQGLIAVLVGQYRQAYSSLRLFLEQSLASVYFSANELQLRLWMQGQNDINWSTINDLELGVFSKKFIGAFSSELVEESSFYHNLAKKVYRECSEYIHGNYNTHQITKSIVTYNKQLFNDWHEKAESIRMIVTFALTARYLFLLESKEDITKLEYSVTDYIGFIPTIQAYYDILRRDE